MRTAAMTTANRHRRSRLGLFPERPTPRLYDRVTINAMENGSRNRRVGKKLKEIIQM